MSTPNNVTVEVTCPNCKQHSFSSKWILKIINTPKKVDINEYAKSVIDEQIKAEQKVNYYNNIFTGTILGSGGIQPPTRTEVLNKYVQLIITCCSCGYTKVLEGDAIQVAEGL